MNDGCGFEVNYKRNEAKTFEHRQFITYIYSSCIHMYVNLINDDKMKIIFFYLNCVCSFFFFQKNIYIYK
jgi:hypothetical protein